MNPPNDHELLASQIREFIAQNLLYSTDGFTYPDDASFLHEGIIDSLGVMQLVDFVHQQFRVDVDPQEVVPENFDSVARLTEFVRRKSQAAPGRTPGSPGPEVNSRGVSANPD